MGLYPTDPTAFGRHIDREVVCGSVLVAAGEKVFLARPNSPWADRQVLADLGRHFDGRDLVIGR
jgi:hypothetical protein